MAVYGSALGAGGLSVGVTMFLRDQFSGPSRRINTSAKNMQRELQAQQRSIMRSQRDANAGMAGIGAMALAGMYQWTKVGAEFDYTMTFVSSLADKTGASFEGLKDKARESALSTIFQSREIADGMRFMAMAGQNAGEIMVNTGPFSKLAQATLWQFGGKGGTADIATNVMRAFNLSQKDAVKTANQLAVATTSSNVNMGDMGESIKYVAASANMLGYKLPEVAAAIGVMGDSGIQGSMAGTSLQNMFQYMSKSVGKFATKRQKTALSMLGIDPNSFVDAEGNLKSISETMNQFKIQTAGMGTQKKLDVMTALFGKRGVRAANALIMNLDKYEGKLKGIINSSGEVNRLAGKQMETLQGHMLILANSWENFKIGFTETLEPVLKPLLTGLSMILQVVTSFMGTGVGSLLTKLATGFLVLKTGIWATRAVVGTLALVTKNLTKDTVMGSTLIARGWNKATASITRYKSAAMAAAVASRGTFVPGAGQIGKYGAMTTAMGTPVFRSAKTGKFMSTAGKGMAAVGIGAGSSGIIASTLTKLGIKGVGRAALGMVPVLGQVAMLGWLAYDIYGMIASNTKETAENTAEQVRSMDDIRSQLDKKMLEIYTLDRRNMESNNRLDYRANRVEGLSDPGLISKNPNINLTLIQDGKKAIIRTIQDQNLIELHNNL